MNCVTLRVARPTDNLTAVARMYAQGLGLSVVAEFADHDGFDGVVLSHPVERVHIEFTLRRGHRVGRAPTEDHLLVFYIPDRHAWEVGCQRMIDAGFQGVVSCNPYWDVRGRTFQDVDGYRVVLQNADCETESTALPEPMVEPGSSGSSQGDRGTRVRRARVDDRAGLLELWERSVRATHHFLEDRDIVALRPLVAEELASDTIEWWVLASAADAVVGMLGYSHDTIEGLFIDPDYRNQGGGKQLVAHAQQLATGPLAVDVNEQNQAALAFYEWLGFTVVGRSATDGSGRPFPIVHMRRARAGAA